MDWPDTSTETHHEWCKACRCVRLFALSLCVRASCDHYITLKSNAGFGAAWQIPSLNFDLVTFCAFCFRTCVRCTVGAREWHFYVHVIYIQLSQLATSSFWCGTRHTIYEGCKFTVSTQFVCRHLFYYIFSRRAGQAPANTTQLLPSEKKKRVEICMKRHLELNERRTYAREMLEKYVNT